MALPRAESPRQKARFPPYLIHNEWPAEKTLSQARNAGKARFRLFPAVPRSAWFRGKISMLSRGFPTRRAQALCRANQYVRHPPVHANDAATRLFCSAIPAKAGKKAHPSTTRVLLKKVYKGSLPLWAHSACVRDRR